MITSPTVIITSLILRQVSAHKDEVASLRVTQKELEDALRRARQEADHFKKQLAEAHRVAMSQASSTTVVAAAVAAVNTQQQQQHQQQQHQQQQQQQQQAFIADSMSDPYPKWSPNQINTMPSASDSYQSKTLFCFTVG